MRIRSRDAPSASDTANAWDILRRAFALILNIDGANTELSFEELYRHVCSMVSARRGSELYQGVRHLVAEHVQQLAQKIIEESDGTDTENVETIPLVVICRAWFPMSKKLELLRGILTFCERIYEPTIGAEPIHQFGWKTFLAEVLENPAVKQKMALSPWLMAEPMRQRQQLNRLVVQRNMLGVGPHDFVESQRFCSDIIIDSLSFLSTPLLGLKCAPVCRQLTFLSDYVLNRRSRVLSPFVISHEEDESGGSRTRGHLLERSKQDFNKYTISTVVGPLDLPDTEPPPWVAGIDTIYLDYCITADAMALLHSLQPMLQHCNVVMDLFILQHWAAQPDKAELIASFLRFFGSNCCFAIHHHQATYYPARGGELRASLQLPLWALFNDLMLTGCRQLELLAQLLSSAQLGLDAAKWLLHESTATRPRRLKLYSNDETYWEHQQREAARGVTPMVKQLKEEFMQSQQKRRFFVDFPTGRGVNHQQDLGEWFNCVGEQLQITQNRIRRVSAGEELKEFEDFYDQLKTGVQPKININFFGQF